MQIFPEQGQSLTLLIRLISARRASKIGVFTGYSALTTPLALPADGRRLACDINDADVRLGQPFWAEANVAGNLPAVYALRSLGRRQATEILEPAKRRRPRASWELRGATRRPVSPFGHELLQAATASRRSIAQVLTVGTGQRIAASASRHVSLAPPSAPNPGRRPFADLLPIGRNRRYGGTERVP